MKITAESLICTVLVIGTVALVFSKYNHNIEMVEGTQSEEVAPVIILKSFDAMTALAEKGEVIANVECWGTKSQQIECKGVGNAIYTGSFKTSSVMPDLRIKGLRGADGKIQVATLTGVPLKLKPAEINELISMFDNPMRQQKSSVPLK